MGRPRMYNQDEVILALALKTYKTVLPVRNIVESNKGLFDVFLLIYYYIFYLASNSYISFH